MGNVLKIFALSLAFLLAGAAFASVEFPARTFTQGNRAPDLHFKGGTYPDTAFEDVAYVSADFLGDLFGEAPRWDPRAQQLRVKRDWVFTLDNPFVSAQGQVYNLTYPVRRGPERIYLPLQPLLRLLRARFGIDLQPAGAEDPPPAPTLAAVVPSVASPSVEPNGLLAGMTLEETPGASVLHLRASPETRWQGVRAGSHYLLRAFDSRLAPGFPRRLTGTSPGALQSVEALQEDDVAQFTLKLRDARDSVEAAPEPGGYRVTVISSEKPAAGKRSGTVILDAGHGGKDRGASVKGVQEADVTLAVTLLLEEELKNLGYTVRLTRDEDVFKTLPERPKYASDNHGDVFVSLHCNSLAGSPARLASVNGYVAYILREGESEEDKAIARRENQAIEQSGKKKAAEISPLDWIVLEHQLNLYSKQSEALAESIIRNFAGFEIPKYSTGARQAGFFVLVGAYMPAVLFEMGFLTHERDRQVLSSRNGQREIARRMAKAIDAFQRSRS